jgi:hypothetical protein
MPVNRQIEDLKYQLEDAQAEIAKLKAQIASREHWLNGWIRRGDSVLMCTGCYCAGCGNFLGLASVALSDDGQYPEIKPDFPFEKATCPLCEYRKTPIPDPVDKLTDRLERLRKT